MSRSLAMKKTVNWLGWPAVGLSIFVLVVFAGIRSFDTFTGAVHEGLFESRYLEHPVITAFHMATGIAFVLLAPLQFLPRFRAKNLGLHRYLGRILVVCALVSGVYGLLASVMLPVFGGVASGTAGWFFGPIFLFSVCRAFWCVRNKKIAQPREWMIRSFALGLAVGSQRIALLFLIPLTGYSFFELFGPALWIGFSFNLLVAELWINLTRAKP